MARLTKKKCDKCNRTFRGTGALLTHQKLHCNNTLCSVCDTEFLTTSLLMEHQLSHVSTISDATSTCTVCNLKLNKRQLKLHMKIHDNAYVTCNKCKRRFKGSVGLKLHLSKGCSLHICKFCNKEFGRAQELRKHEKTHLKVSKKSCPICKVKVPKLDWSSHMTTHPDCKECKKCRRIFQNDLGLKVHMSSGCHKHTCKHCNKIFVMKKRLTEHMVKHTGSTRVKCHKCNHSFYHKGALKAHLRRVHERTPKKQLPKVNTCDLCNKNLKTVGGLYEHFSWCHKQLCLGNYDHKFKDSQLIPCSLCDKHVKVEDYALHKHIEISEARYVGPVIQSTKCGQCHHSFAKIDYNFHIDVHKTRKDFKDNQDNLWRCIHCRKVFNNSSRRKRHQDKCRQGTTCVFCGICCADYKTLEIHTTVHTREKPYSCKICSQSFSTKSGLTRHIRRDKHLVNAGLKSCSNLSLGKKKKSKSSGKIILNTCDRPAALFFCCQCKFRSNNRAEICGHVETYHQIRVPQILKENDIKFTDESNEEYQIINGRSRRSTCYLCSKTFFSDFASRDHITICEFKHGLRIEESTDQEKSLQNINTVEESVPPKPCLVLVKH